MLESSSIPNGRKRSHPNGTQHNYNPPNNWYAPYFSSSLLILCLYVNLTRATSSSSPRLGHVKTEHDEPSNNSSSQSRQSHSHPAEALNESQRGSLGGPLQSTSQTTVSPAVVKPSGSSRTSAQNPNMGVARITHTSNAPSGPNPISVPGLSLFLIYHCNH